MDWKSTAVISGAGILATWFFSMPVAHQPAAAVSRPAPAARARSATGSSIDIQQEAARLGGRVRADLHYADPVRNPFRFGDRAPADRPLVAGSSVPPAPVAPPAPSRPQILLDGIATDVVGGQEQRTAILKTDAGVVLAREGDQVGGLRVEKIGTDAVDLVNPGDGSALHVSLR